MTESAGDSRLRRVIFLAGISPSTKFLPSQKFVWAPPRLFCPIAKYDSGVRFLTRMKQFIRFEVIISLLYIIPSRGKDIETYSFSTPIGSPSVDGSAQSGFDSSTLCHPRHNSRRNSLRSFPLERNRTSILSSANSCPIR